MRIPTLGLLSLFLTPAVAAGQATLVDLGGQQLRPDALSPDGAWAVGTDYSSAFRWSASTGFQTFTSGFGGTVDIAPGGAPIAVTLLDSSGVEQAGLWTPTGVTLLGGLGAQTGNSISWAFGCSDDATTVVGQAWIAPGRSRAFRWTRESGLIDLGAQVSTGSSGAYGVSGDGTRVVGWDEDGTGTRHPATWSGGVSSWLSNLPGEALAADQDGSVVVGGAGYRAFRWTREGGLHVFDLLSGSNPLYDRAAALGVSADGDTLVGSNGSFNGTPYRAFLWRPGAGLVDVEELLVALGAPGAAGVGLSSATDVSADGRTILLQSGPYPFGPFKGWVATLPEVATRYCSAQTHSQGCTPTISSSGTPSASSGAGFVVSTSRVIEQTSGVLFYGTTGPASVPFQGGVLCVAGPITSTPAQDSGGSGPCGGSLSLDFNAWVASGQDPALVGGTTVWAQYWCRDPGSPGGTSLTDALEFTLWP